MSKGLEAWENINDNLELLDDGFNYDDEFARILTDDLDIIKEELEEGQKAKKALDTIKELPDKYKQGLVYILLNALNERKITSEQYELLREVLL